MGADIACTFFTGNMKRLSLGSLVGIETVFGWTISGRLPPQMCKTSSAMLVTTMLVNEMNVADFWRLDLLGIEDPSERKTRTNLQEEARRHFLDTVCINEEGRYEVHLPWKEDHPVLPTNFELALKRLSNTRKKLENDGCLNEYEMVLQEWLAEGIIEEVPFAENDDSGHYLPHRHVLKLNSTTKVRPVFDASAHEKHLPCLNQCLEKGCNLIEQIPPLLHKFRMNEFGVVADIRRAFLQISVKPSDRKFLKFLWQDASGKLIVYQHKRVVFGLTSSPFLLGAVIQYHLEKKREEFRQGNSSYSLATIETLLKSFYVDNVIVSLNSAQELHTFMREATAIMAEYKFDLRGWEYSDSDCNPHSMTPVLGLSWNRKDDTLQLNSDNLRFSFNKVTKRVIMSAAHRVFDLLGIVSPVTLSPKILLKELWESKIGWDEEVPEQIAAKFLTWVGDLQYLEKVKVPRWFPGMSNGKHVSLHVFTDACETSYAAVLFLRVESESGTKVQLLQSKSRVTPVKKITIPRLELLAANIGSRLYDSVHEFFPAEIETYFWCDSTTVLAWLRRQENWGTYVSNRVNEIRKLTPVEQWRHIPGILNPADLPSRGCLGKKLSESLWWEGPEWLYQPASDWPSLVCEYDEELIAKEKKKIVVSSMLASTSTEDRNWYYRYFSQYEKLVRMIAWIKRFVNNSRSEGSELFVKKKGPLSIDEITNAELLVLTLVQRESFDGVKDPRISSLRPFEDHTGLIRLRTKISNRPDSIDFRYPVLLPRDHPVIIRLLRSIHERECHVGVQGLLAITRERFWVIGGRRTMKSVISSCVICKRHETKRMEAPTTPLPIDRVREASAFEVVGVDLTGPIYLKGRQKAWICLFTCAVVRAVHFELLLSLSTEDFLLGLRRFISRRGRPARIYSDRGSNFTGADNLFQKIDWTKVLEYCNVNRISWKFNPATASWWGDWWERLIGLSKRLLKKVLGRSKLSYTEMETVLCDCESVLNARSLTFMSDKDREPVAITPSMFIQDIRDARMPELDVLETKSLDQRLQYRTKLKEDLRSRFRNEYLGQLRMREKNSKHDEIKLNDVVLIGNDCSKRIDWPLARVIELLPGTDGIVRLVRLKTAYGECLRPVQRLYRMLEAQELLLPDEESSSEVELHDSPKSSNEKTVETGPPVSPKQVKRTIRGRLVKLPAKYLDYAM